jgi:hypothetical protein
MARDFEVNTDWERSVGVYNCSVCGRQRLCASEFSKKQVEKALEAYKSIKDKDIREDPNIQQSVFLSAVCKKCIQEKEDRERQEAQARRDEAEARSGEREKILEETVLETPERVVVSIGERPFGMSSSKADDANGYLVSKVTEGKPASKAGVRPGWRVVTVAGKSCEGLDVDAVLALFKAADLPVELEFESVPDNADYCTACQRVLPASLFSRKMRTKPRESRRCSACVEASQAEPEKEEGGETGKPQSQLDELKALCAESAVQAEKVTGLKPVRGGGYIGRGGRARGGRR